MAVPFNVRLKEALRLRKMSQAELSRASGYPSSRICNYVNGTFGVNDQTARTLADALKVDVDWLLGGNVTVEGLPIETTAEPNYANLPPTWREALEIVCMYMDLTEIEERQRFREACQYYRSLDSNDRAVIRGEMRQMLRDSKYRDDDDDD